MPDQTTPAPDLGELLTDVDIYLRSRHKIMNQHDNGARYLGCHGCDLQQRVVAAIESARALIDRCATPVPPADLIIRTERARANTAEAERDAVYRERAHLVAVLAILYPSVIVPAGSDQGYPTYGLVYVHTPAGQVSWHIAPADLDLFAHVRQVDPQHPDAQWDHHDKDAALARLRSLAEQAREICSHVGRCWSCQLEAEADHA